MTNEATCKLMYREKRMNEKYKILADQALVVIANAKEAINKIESDLDELNEFLEDENSSIYAEAFNIRSQTAQIYDALQKTKDQSLKMKNSTVFLESCKEGLKKAQEEHKRELTIQHDASVDAENMLKSVINLDLVREAHQTLKKYHNKFGGDAKDRFNKACEVIKQEHKKLKNLGFISRGLNYLYYCSHNRPDRDDPRSVDFSDYCDLIKIENQEN